VTYKRLNLLAFNPNCKDFEHICDKLCAIRGLLLAFCMLPLASIADFFKVISFALSLGMLLQLVNCSDFPFGKFGLLGELESLLLETFVKINQ